MTTPHERRRGGWPRRERRAFTLIELLVVMVIIAILSAMVLGALASAYETAKVAKTKATIAKIHNQLAHRWDSYRTRRLQVPTSGMTPLQAANVRLLALWELQRIEMPDDYGDLSLSPSFNQNNALWQAYNMARNQVPNWTPENASAECLYLTLTVGMNGDDEVHFLDNEVGDTDRDGMPEFIDGWGRPIRWIRWAPGYVPRLGADSDFQRDDPPGSTAPMSFQADPFDPRGLCRQGGAGNASLIPPPGNSTNYYGFKLMPLVYSAGPDGEYGIADPTDSSRAGHPYAYYSDPNTSYIGNLSDKPRGTPLKGLEGGGHLDNITNHRLGTR